MDKHSDTCDQHQLMMMIQWTERRRHVHTALTEIYKFHYPTRRGIILGQGQFGHCQVVTSWTTEHVLRQSFMGKTWGRFRCHVRYKKNIFLQKPEFSTGCPCVRRINILMQWLVLIYFTVFIVKVHGLLFDMITQRKRHYIYQQ